MFPWKPSIVNGPVWCGDKQPIIII